MFLLWCTSLDIPQWMVGMLCIYASHSLTYLWTADTRQPMWIPLKMSHRALLLPPLLTTSWFLTSILSQGAFHHYSSCLCICLCQNPHHWFIDAWTSLTLVPHESTKAVIQIHSSLLSLTSLQPLKKCCHLLESATEYWPMDHSPQLRWPYVACLEKS